MGWGKKAGSACALVALNMKVNISISILSLFHEYKIQILKLNCL